MTDAELATNKKLFESIYEKLTEDAEMPRQYRGPTPVAMLLTALAEPDDRGVSHALRFFKDVCKLYLGPKADWFRSHNVGRFSTVTDDQGRDFQFHTGRDNYETYKVGDKVNQRVFPDALFQGVLLDGAYLGESCKWENAKAVEHVQKWVVIKDAVVVALVDVEYEKDAPNVILDGEVIQAEVVAHRHGVVPTPLDSWTPEAYAKYARQEAEAARTRREWDIEDYGLTLSQKAANASRRFFGAMMREDGFYRRILPPVPVEGPKPADDNPLKVSIVESSP